MPKSYTLTLGTGANKRQWKLSEKEFKQFERMFEEAELIDISRFDPSKIKLTLVEVPQRRS